MTNRLRLIGFLAAIGTASPTAHAAAQAPTERLEPSPADRPTTAPLPRPDPRQHLDEATRVLGAIAVTSLDAEGGRRLARLRDDFASLATNYRTPALLAPDLALTPVPTVPAAPGAPATPVANWRANFDAVERDLTSILGNPSTPTMDSPRAPGTSPLEPAIAAPKPIPGKEFWEMGISNLDASVRTELLRFRTSVELFYDATTGLGSAN